MGSDSSDVDSTVARQAPAGSESSGEHGFALENRLRARETRGLRRELSPVDRVAERGRFAVDPRGGRPAFAEEHLVFAANNYLGLTDDERVQAAAAAAAREVGTGSGASRLVTGDTGVHRGLERELAAARGTDRALVFSSGYAANVGTIAALGPDVVFSDEHNHASIIDGIRLSGAEVAIYDHCDVTDLAHKMDGRPADADESWLVVTDSVFSMDGDVAPLESVCTVAEQHGAWVMVDEAHATGLYTGGGGIVQREDLSDRVHIQMGTLSKALAAQGGYVAGSEALIEVLLNEARSFVYSTGLAPPAAAAATEALRIARDGHQRDRLWRNVHRLRDGLEAAGFAVRGDTQILPVMVGDPADAVALATAMYERGVVAPAIRPPTVPEGTSRIRVAPTAAHEVADIDACIDAFRCAAEAVDL